MATENRSELGTDFDTLFDPGQPKVSKSSLKTAILKLVNGYLNLRDDSWQKPVKGVQNDPPGSPTSGDRYVVGPAPTGAWDGYDHNVAEWDGTAWVFSAVLNGALVFNTDSATTAYLKGEGAFRTVRVPKSSFARLGTDTNTTNNTLQQINALAGAVKSGGRYRVDLRLLLKSNTSTQGLKIGLAGPGSTSVSWTAHIPDAVNSEHVQHGSAFGAAATSATAPDAMVFVARLEAVVINPATDGTIYALFASGDGVAQITALDGSTLEITEITT